MKNTQKQLILGFSLLLFLLSCKESQTEKITHLVNEWQGKQIYFPSNTVFTTQIKDTVSYGIPESDYKVLIYVDTIGCTSCKLQLPRWKEIMSDLDSISGKEIPFLFFFHPKDLKELRYILRRDNFKHPVCVDIKDSLNQLNHFPSNLTFQTFLLDRNNRVVVLGNPVHNPKVKDLYLKVITGKERKTVPVTDAELSVSLLDFGTFDWKKAQTEIVKIKNTGKQLLVIQDINTSCGCIEAKYSPKPIASGEEATIDISYKADHPEYFEKTLTIYGNIQNAPIQITIKGNAQ